MSKRRHGPARSRTPGLVAAVVIAAAVVAGLAIWAANRSNQPLATPHTAGAVGTRLGPDSAPVTVELFSDFQCSHCRTAADDITPPLIEEYVNAGRVQLVYRFLPRLGVESLTSAKAAFCAGEQGQFWGYHDLLFRAQRGVDRGAFAADRLRAMAQELNLDLDAWSGCLEAEQTRQRIEADVAAGEAYGLRGTPTFVIRAGNRGTLVEGAVPYPDLRQAVQAVLEQ